MFMRLTGDREFQATGLREAARGVRKTQNTANSMDLLGSFFIIGLIEFRQLPPL